MAVRCYEPGSTGSPDSVRKAKSAADLGARPWHLKRTSSASASLGFQRYLNLPIVILNSYRSSEYNRAIGDAAPKSLHMQFKALDIAVAGVAPAAVFRILKEWRDAGKFKGGLRLYRTFVHIDTRGINATWGE